MKKFLDWLISKVLLPLLAQALGEILKLILQAVAKAIDALMEKWRKTEEAQATTQAGRDEVNERYAARKKDLREAFDGIAERIPSIVEQALRDSHEEHAGLLRGEPAPKLSAKKGGPAGKPA